MPWHLYQDREHQTDLWSSSSEILSLLKNRQGMRRELSQSVDDLAVIEQLISTIIFARIENLIPTFQIGLQVAAVKDPGFGDNSKT